MSRPSEADRREQQEDGGERAPGKPGRTRRPGPADVRTDLDEPDPIPPPTD